MENSYLLNFSPPEVDLLERFLAEPDGTSWSYLRRNVEFLLYVSGKKPATEMTHVTKSDTQSTTHDSGPPAFVQLLSKLPVPYIRTEKSLNDSLTAVSYECLPEKSATLPEVTEPEAAYHRAWGRHYGYPNQAIDAFINDDCLRYGVNEADYERLQSLGRSVGLEDEQLRLLPLVSFWPANSASGVEEAATRAAENRAHLLTVQSETSLDVVDGLLNAVVDRPNPVERDP
jgi:hypothetical protein